MCFAKDTRASRPASIRVRRQAGMQWKCIMVGSHVKPCIWIFTLNLLRPLTKKHVHVCALMSHACCSLSHVSRITWLLIFRFTAAAPLLRMLENVCINSVGFIYIIRWAGHYHGTAQWPTHAFIFHLPHVWRRLAFLFSFLSSEWNRFSVAKFHFIMIVSFSPLVRLHRLAVACWCQLQLLNIQFQIGAAQPSAVSPKSKANMAMKQRTFFGATHRDIAQTWRKK